METLDFTIPNLGTPKVPSPVMLSKVMGDLIANYVNDGEYVINEVTAVPGQRVEYKKRGSC